MRIILWRPHSVIWSSNKTSHSSPWAEIHTWVTYTFVLHTKFNRAKNGPARNFRGNCMVHGSSDRGAKNPFQNWNTLHRYKITGFRFLFRPIRTVRAAMIQSQWKSSQSRCNLVAMKSWLVGKFSENDSFRVLKRHRNIWFRHLWIICYSNVNLKKNIRFFLPKIVPKIIVPYRRGWYDPEIFSVPGLVCHF